MSTHLTVLAVPGVGLWPPLLEPVVERVGANLQERTGDVSVEIVTRPTDRLDFGHQVAHLAERCREATNAVLVGISGGATLALACAIDATAGLRAIVTHEPLIGPLEPELHDRVEQAGTRLAAKPSEEAAMGFVAGLYGTGWTDAGIEAHGWARSNHQVICREVAQFATFHPSSEALSVSVPHLTTVGARSGPERHRVASNLVAAGAVAAVIENCGHLVPVEQPESFADVLTDFLCDVTASPAPVDDRGPEEGSSCRL